MTDPDDSHETDAAAQTHDYNGQSQTLLEQLIDGADQSIERYIDQKIREHLETGGGSESDGSGGRSDEELIDLIKQHAPGGDSERLDALIERAERALARLELTTGLRGETITVGPKAPTSDDSYHTNPLWGVHFSTEHDIHLGRTTIDSLSSGEFTIVCYRYEAGELRAVAGEQTIRANGHEQRVPLEMSLDPGEYLLTRPVPGTRDDVGGARQDLPDIAFYPNDEAVSLRRRADYDGWEDDSTHGLTWYGGANPSFNDNKYWYYWFSTEVTVDPGEAITTAAEENPDDVEEYEPPAEDITGSEP